MIIVGTSILRIITGVVMLRNAMAPCGTITSVGHIYIYIYIYTQKCYFCSLFMKASIVKSHVCEPLVLLACSNMFNVLNINNLIMRPIEIIWVWIIPFVFFTLACQTASVFPTIATFLAPRRCLLELRSKRLTSMHRMVYICWLTCLEHWRNIWY